MPVPTKKLIPPFVTSNLPTAEDSATLYNNTMRLLDFYNKPKEYELKEQKPVPLNKPNSFITNSNLEDVKNFSKSKRFSEQLNRPLTVDDYYKPVDKNKYYKREKQFGVLNLDAPMALYDRRIKPSQQYTFHRSKYGDLTREFENAFGKLKNEKYSEQNHERFLNILDKLNSINDPLKTDHVTFYGYDPVQIKPFYMLTPEEKIARKKLEMTPEHIQAVKEQQSLAQTSTNNFTKNQKELLLKQKQLVEEIITPYGKMSAESYKKQFGQKAYERDFRIKK